MPSDQIYTECNSREYIPPTKRREHESSVSSSDSILDKPEFAKPIIRQTYPSLEGGWAWVIVFSCCLIHVLTRGVLFSTGVLFSEWTSYFGKSKSETAWIGSIATGCALLLGPITSRLIERWGYRSVAMVGGGICFLGLGLSCWATSIQFLYITYGVLAGSGLGITYLCGVVAVGEYFEERRSLAFGIAASGAGCGAAIIAILQRVLLNEYGWQGTMLLLAGVSGLNQIVCGALLRPLSSSLNWLSKKSRRRLAIHRGMYSYETSETDTNSNSDCSERNNFCNNKEKDMLFVPSLIESAQSLTSEGYYDVCNDKNNNEFLQNSPEYKNYLEIPTNKRVRTYSDSRVGNKKCMSPSMLLRNKLKQACENDQTNTENTNARFETRIRMAKSHGHLADTTIENEKSYSNINEEDVRHHYTPRSTRNPRLRLGDALYLSSISISTSAMVANEILSKNTPTKRHSATMRSQDVSQRKSYLQSGFDLHESCSSMDSISTSNANVLCNNCKGECTCCDFDDMSNHELSTQIRQTKPTSVLKNPLFIMLAINQFFTGLGVMVPFVHLAEKAVLMGIDDIRAAYLVSLIGIGNVTGKIILGILCDMKRTDIFIVFLVAQFGMAASIAMFPIFSTYYSLVIASLAFGFFYGNYAAVPSLTAGYVGLQNLGQAMGYINFLEGAAGIIGPPLAGAIYDVCLNYNIAFGIAASFLFVSVFVLLLQPFLYKRTTGRRSSISIFIDSWRISSKKDLNGNLLNLEKST